ncbi:MAG TPA: AAA family ATPase [Gemmatimonadaceae bacterium]|nr:AAA family ATPase [Gemmatimonadaceae bacterium]
MPHFCKTPDELATAAEKAVGTAAAKHPVAVVVAQVDHPPTNGKSAASEERVLHDLREIVMHSLRPSDLVGVLDGRLIMVVNDASAEDARVIGDRLCAAARNRTYGDTRTHVTISIGAASAPEHGNNFERVLATSSGALERIRLQGGDGSAAAPAPHHEPLHRPLSIDHFAGRSREFGSLVEWLEEADAGSPRVVSLTGDVGSGTSTLLAQLEPEVRLRGGLFALVSSNERAVPEPYEVWRAFLRATHLFPTAPSREWSELQHLEPSFSGRDTSGHPGSQYRLLGELSEYTRALAVDRPLVIVLDDMQWADATSWDALEHFLSSLDRDRIMICLARHSVAIHDADARRCLAARPELVRELAISSLTRDEVKQWLEAAFHRQQVGRELLAYVYRQTEGNPLTIAQLLRALVETGAIWHNGTRWEWTPVSELRLRTGRAPLVAQRLSRFSSSTQAVLATAAVVGRDFEVSVLVGASAGSEAAVRLALNEALAASFVVPTRERGQAAFVFAHDEIAEVLVDNVPRDQLRQLHHRVGRSLERLHPERPAEIALHYDAAGDSTDAYRWAQQAATAAERVYAYGSARSLLHVAARNATSAAELAEVRVSLAHICETGGRFDEVEELCDLAIEWFEGQGDERRALSLRRMRERARMELGQPARVTLDALTALNAEAKRLGFDRERVSILLLMSQIHARLGDKRTSERMAAEGVEMAESLGDAAILADAVTRLGNSILSSAPGRAYPILRRALELYESIGDVRGQARTYGNLGVAAQWESRLDEARQAYSRAIAMARAGGMPDVWGLVSVNLGVLYQKCGEYDRAKELFSEALELFAAVKHSEFQLAALFNLAHVERELGAWEAATELYETTIPLAQRIGQADIEIGAIAGAGLCALELGKLDAARVAVSELTSRMGDRTDWFQGRELVEALFVRMDAAEGRNVQALTRFATAVSLAEAADVYSAAWLVAVCSDSLAGADQPTIERFVGEYDARVKKLGYAEMTRRFDMLAHR